MPVVNLAPHSAVPKIVTMYKEPKVLIMPIALQKMNLYIELNSKEVGWLGTVQRYDDSLLIIEDCYLFRQQVHAATCEITPDGLTEFAEQLLTQADGMEIWNNLRLWGHSHVNMGTFASAQDDTQMKLFKEGGHPWFLRCIGNKAGRLQFTFYDYEHSITVEDVAWSVYVPPITELRAVIEAEVKDKVTDFPVATTTYYGNSGRSNWWKEHGYRDYDDYDDYGITKDFRGEKAKKKKHGKIGDVQKTLPAYKYAKMSELPGYYGVSHERNHINAMITVFNEKTLLAYFTEADLFRIAGMQDVIAIETEVVDIVEQLTGFGVEIGAASAKYVKEYADILLEVTLEDAVAATKSGVKKTCANCSNNPSGIFCLPFRMVVDDKTNYPNCANYNIIEGKVLS